VEQFEAYSSSRSGQTGLAQTDLYFGAKDTKGGHIAITKRAMWSTLETQMGKFSTISMTPITPLDNYLVLSHDFETDSLTDFSMNQNISELQRKLCAEDRPERALMVQYLRAVVMKAREVSVRKRDSLAYELIRPFVEQNISLDDEEDLDYIVFQLAGGELDVLREEGIAMRTQEERQEAWVRKEAVWEELIRRVEGLES